VGEPAPLKTIAERSRLDLQAAEAELATMVAEGQVILLGTGQSPLAGSATPAISAGGWRMLAARMAETLEEYHAQFPLRPGIAREEFKNAYRATTNGRPSCSTSWLRGRPRGRCS